MDKQKELAQAQTQVQDKSDNEEIQEPEEYEEPEIQEEVKISAKVNVPTIIKNTKIVGKCMQMCPHNEIKYREEHRNLAIFEYDPIGHKADLKQFFTSIQGGEVHVGCYEAKSALNTKNVTCRFTLFITVCIAKALETCCF